MAGNWNSGRRKQPAALKLLRGNPGKRRGPNLPPPPIGPDFDTPPLELTDNDRARHEWQRVAPLLRESGYVGDAERSTLLALCLEWATYLEAQTKLRKSRLKKNATGGVRVSPFVAIADRALNQCRALWNELGLTPSSRARVARVPRAEPPASKWGNI